MKNLLKMFVLTAGLLLCFNVNSYAGGSISGWIGIGAGNLEFADYSDFDFGFNTDQYGIRLHYNFIIFSPIGLSLGGFYSHTNLRFNHFQIDDEEDFKTKRHATGADLALFLTPWSKFYPYVKGTYAFYDTISYWKIKGSGIGIGGGFEYLLSPHMKLYAELMLEDASYTNSLHNLDMFIFNFGVTFTDAAEGRFHKKPARSKIQKSNQTSNVVKAKPTTKAVNKVSIDLIQKLPANSIVVIVNVASDNRELSLFVIDELEYRMVNSNKFRIVDRKRLEAILNEQKFQMTGLVNDDSIVGIGKMLGANFVITGDITPSGSKNRLSVRALDVQTAQIVAMSRETF